MQLRHSVAAAALAAAGLAVGTAPAAWAVNEARIVHATCTGFTVVQTGLPPGLRFRLVALDADSGRTLATAHARSGTGGRLQHTFAVPLAHRHRLMVDVERGRSGEAEYGEAGLDLHLRCGSGAAATAGAASGSGGAGVTGTGAVTGLGGPAAGSGGRSPAAPVGVAAALAAVTGLSWYAVRRRSARRS